jgi:hypothetical protein
MILLLLLFLLLPVLLHRLLPPSCHPSSPSSPSSPSITPSDDVGGGVGGSSSRFRQPEMIMRAGFIYAWGSHPPPSHPRGSECKHYHHHHDDHHHHHHDDHHHHHHHHHHYHPGALARLSPEEETGSPARRCCVILICRRARARGGRSGGSAGLAGVGRGWVSLPVCPCVCRRGDRGQGCACAFSRSCALNRRVHPRDLEARCRSWGYGLNRISILGRAEPRSAEHRGPLSPSLPPARRRRRRRRRRPHPRHPLGRPSPSSPALLSALAADPAPPTRPRRPSPPRRRHRHRLRHHHDQRDVSLAAGWCVPSGRPACAASIRGKGVSEGEEGVGRRPRPERGARVP